MSLHRSLLCIALICSSGSAWAQVEFTQANLSACTQDIRAHCASIKAGGGRVIKCLRDNPTKISAECSQVVAVPSDYPTSGERGLSFKVTIDGIKSNDGFIILVLGDDGKIFPRGRRTIIAPAKSGSITVTFQHLKPNKYAVFAFHDENDNGKMDVSPVGLPAEGGGFSNNLLGIPSFQHSAVEVLQDTSIKMSMNYF